MTPQKKRHYSIRKLRAGVGSILIGTTLLFGLSTQFVQANTTADGTTSGSAGGTTAAPDVTATGTNAATTATGGETATEEKPKVEEPTEKPVEETAPKAEDKKEAETPNTPTNPADYPIVKELEKLLKEVEELPELESTDYFKEQINIWNEQKELAKQRLDIAKKGKNTEKVEGFLGDYVQYANIEKMARHAQQLYKKHGPNAEMLELIKKAFGIEKDKNTYASLEGSHLVTYVNNDVIRPYNQILELARKLDEEKAKKEKEKEQPAPAPAPEEPKKEGEKPTPAPAPEEPKKEGEKPTPAPTPEEPKKEGEKPTPAPTPEEPKKEEEKPTPAPTPEEPKKEEKPAPAPAPEEPKKEEEKPTPAPTPEPKKDTEKPAPSQPKQDDSMKKDYKLFYQTKDKTEEVDFKGTPEELKATLDKAIEKYKQDGYPYVDRFERENRILLVFNQHKSIIVLETNGDGGSRQSRPFYGTPQELEAEIKKLTESLSDTYKIEKKEGYDKLDPTVKTITLVLTKLSDTPKETPAPKKEDKPTPPKDEKQTQPEGKKAEKPKDEKAEKPKDEKQTQPEGKKPEQPKDKKPVPAPKKAEKAMPSKARTPKKVLPNTGEVPSILALLGSGLLGFLGMSQIKRRKK
ncbi:GAG-binding domain-containing protein [Streptococcus ruminantium]|uniref:GAG-binding domain-containing protein n=1 Tax=Streptococcus ruminantium TaxID=1917441 RepID=UPI001F00A791|nr:GAG-binding domain-containing protein [Streptococcus ruminantium]BDD42072.1 hypothetical protein GUT189_04050 [Streptococcus ruminantium]